jgi:RNA polymerase sigma-70 factor (ECF subfamily)
MAFPLVSWLFASGENENPGGSSLPANRPSPAFQPRPQREESDWIAGIQTGDTAIFTELVHDLTDVLHAYAYRYVHSSDIAYDIVQDVFARLWENRQTLHVKGTIRQYLFIATRLRALELLRRNKIEERHASVLIPESDAISVDEQLDQIDLFAQVVRAIQELTPRQREIARLHWIHGLTNATVAERLGISIKGVEIQLTRALARLRMYFQTE